MDKDLLDELVKKPQRETAGSSSASRFDYQKHWAFCEMLRRHMDNADYLVAFEFHDDVVFLEPTRQPAAADFVQVKTSSSAKPRKIADIVVRKKEANSILGKMCLNFDGICSSHDMRVILVSNTAFEFSDKDIAAKDLDPKYRDRIVEKLKAEIPALTDAQIERLHFIVSGVSIEAIQTYLNGQAMELFKSHFGEGHGLNVHSWVRLIQGEISRKNNYPSDKITSVTELMSKKCLSKSEVIDTLGVVAKTKQTLNMTLVNPELQSAGWTTVELMRLGKSIPQATLDFTDATNSEVTKIVEAIFDAFDANKDGVISIAEFIAAVCGKLMPNLSQPYNDKSYLSALAILVFHEKI